VPSFPLRPRVPIPWFGWMLARFRSSGRDVAIVFRSPLDSCLSGRPPSLTGRSYVNYLEMRVAYLEALCATSNINFSPADDFLDISPIPILSPIPISSARSAQPTATAVNAHFVPDHLGSYLYPAQVAASSYSPSPPYLPLNVSSKSTSPSSIDTQGTPKRRRKTYQQNTYHQGHGDMMLHPAPQPRVYLPPAQAAPGDWRRTHMTQFGIPEFEVEMWEHDSWNDDGNSGQVGLLDGFYFGNRS